MRFSVVLGVVSVNSCSVVVIGRHVWVKTNIKTKEWRMVNLSMTHVMRFLVVHSLSEVLMSEGFGKWLWVCHDGRLDSNIMDGCNISRLGDNMCGGSNVCGSSDVSDRSDRSNRSDGILREKRTDMMGEVLSDVASISRCYFDDGLLVFVEGSVWVIDR